MTHLTQPATSLKVIVSANRPPEADFRVFYRLLTADSTEVGTTFRAFPGFKNLKDIDGDGFGDEVIDEANNDGRPDASGLPSLFASSMTSSPNPSPSMSFKFLKPGNALNVVPTSVESAVNKR